PTAGFTNNTSSFSGVVRNTAGNPIDGVNIVAHSTTDPLGQAISCVSGYLDTDPGLLQTGSYKIPGLTPNSTWVLDFEQIHSNFTGGSRVGPIQPPVDIASPPEYINDTGETTGDDVKHTTTFVAPASNTTMTGLDLRLNNPPAVQNVSEVDNGVTISSAQVLT